MATISLILPSRDFKTALERALDISGWDEAILVVASPVHPAHLRNVGARSAKGDILAFVDDDITLEGSLTWFRDRPPEEAFWGPSKFMDATGDPETIATVKRINATAALGLGAASMGAFMVIRKGAFQTIGGFDPDRMAEDSNLGTRLTLAGYKHHQSPHVVTFLRPCPSYAQLMERYPEWKRFARPERLPCLRLTALNVGLRVEQI